MKAEKFFHFVHSLTRYQKKKVEASFSNEKKTLDYLLYKRILAESQYDEAAQQRIRGKKFLSSSNYLCYRERLGTRILDCIAAKNDPYRNVKASILQGVKMDAVELAQRIASLKVKELLGEEDFESAYSIMLFCKRLNSDYRIQIEFSSSLPSEEIIKSRIDSLERLNSLLDRMRKALKTSNDKRRIAANWSERQLRCIEIDSERERFLFEKGKTIIALLRNQVVYLFELQQGLVNDFVMNSSRLTGVQRIKEVSLLARIAALVGKRSSAIKYSVIADQIEINHPIDKSELIRMSIMLQITIGEYFVNLALIESGLEILKNNPNAFPKPRTLKLLSFSALGYFYANKYQESIELIQKIKRFSISTRTEILWEPEVLLLLIHFELGTPDVFDSMLAKAYHSAKKSPCRSPRKIISIIRKLNQLPSADRLAYLRTALLELEQLKSIPAESRSFLLFDFTLWMQSKIDGISMTEIINDRRKDISQVALAKLSI